jgi:AAA family ATPase
MMWCRFPTFSDCHTAVDSDIILPGCSFPVQQKGSKYQHDGQQKSQKLRVTVQSIDPLPTEKYAVYFDLLTTQVTTTIEVPTQQHATASRRVLQLKSDGIGGLSDHVTAINKRLSFLTNSLPFQRDFRLSGPTSFLLHGPEGTGKSLLLERLAECPWKEVYTINSDTNPKGQAKVISETFEEARENQPSLILMDNLDRFLDKAESLVNRLRTELTKLGGTQVVVAAAARSLYDVDASLRSPSAFKTKLELYPPNAKQREEILRQVLGPNSKLTGVDFPILAERTHGFVGRDIRDLCTLARDRVEQRVDESIGEEMKASFGDRLEQVDFVRQEDLDAVFEQVRPTVLKDSILEVPEVKWTDIAGLDHVRALLEAITIRPFKVSFQHMFALRATRASRLPYPASPLLERQYNN